MLRAHDEAHTGSRGRSRELSDPEREAKFIVTRYESGDGVTTVALVTAKVGHDSLTQEGAFLRALTAAASGWVRDTKAGEAALEESSKGLNVGDLSMHCDEETLRAYLRLAGIRDLRIQTLDTNSGASYWSYDMRLVDIPRLH